MCLKYTYVYPFVNWIHTVKQVQQLSIDCHKNAVSSITPILVEAVSFASEIWHSVRNNSKMWKETIVRLSFLMLQIITRSYFLNMSNV